MPLPLSTPLPIPRCEPAPVRASAWPPPRPGSRPSGTGLAVVALHGVALAALWWHGPSWVLHPLPVPATLRVIYAAPVPEPAPPQPAAERDAAAPSRNAPRPPAPPATAAPVPRSLASPGLDAPAQPLGTVALAAPAPTTDASPVEAAAEAAPPAASAPAPAPAPPAPRAVPPSAVAYRVPPPVQVPLASRRLGESGTVWLRVWVDEAGRPRQVSLHRSSGHARLDEQALWAMGQARFRPQTEQGVPIEWVVIAPIAYELE